MTQFLVSTVFNFQNKTLLTPELGSAPQRLSNDLLYSKADLTLELPARFLQWLPFWGTSILGPSHPSWSSSLLLQCSLPGSPDLISRLQPSFLCWFFFPKATTLVLITKNGLSRGSCPQRVYSIITDTGAIHKMPIPVNDVYYKGAWHTIALIFMST